MKLKMARLKFHLLPFPLQAFLLQVYLCAPVSGQSFYANLSQAFPPLQALYQTHLEKSPSIGGQNFTQCCLQAVSESYIIQNDDVFNNPNTSQNFIGLSPTDLNSSQFPCGASYSGDSAGAPLVTVPYSWCKQNCGGWEKSTNKVLTQWVQPFVGFILPAAVFCLNVSSHHFLGEVLG